MNRARRAYNRAWTFLFGYTDPTPMEYTPMSTNDPYEPDYVPLLNEAITLLRDIRDRLPLPGDPAGPCRPHTARWCATCHPLNKATPPVEPQLRDLTTEEHTALCERAFENLPKNTTVTVDDVDAILTWCLPEADRIRQARP